MTSPLTSPAIHHCYINAFEWPAFHPRIPRKTQLEPYTQLPNVFRWYFTYSFLVPFADAGALEGKDPANIARGWEAAIHNPKVSEEAKTRAQEQLDSMGASTTEAPQRFSATSDAGGADLEHNSRQLGPHLVSSFDMLTTYSTYRRL
jgi:hypothetical protein